MNELSLAAVKSHMGYAPPASGGEKDEIPPLEGIPRHRATGLELCAGVARQFQTVETINGHGQTAAIETAAGGGAPPSIGRADKPPRRLHETIVEILPGIGLPTGRTGTRNVKDIDDTTRLQFNGPPTCRRFGFESIDLATVSRGSGFQPR